MFELFISTTSTEDFRESSNVEHFASADLALRDLIEYTREEKWSVTPEIEDGEIVYRISGEDIKDGLATITEH